MKEPKPSQAQIDYTKRSYYVGIIAVIVAVTGIYVSYHLGQQSKFTVEPQKLVSQQEVVPTPSPVPIVVALPPSPTPSPSPTPKVAKQRKPRRSIPQEELIEGPCYTDGEGGEEILVDCETGEEIEP